MAIHMTRQVVKLTTKQMVEDALLEASLDQQEELAREVEEDDDYTNDMSIEWEEDYYYVDGPDDYSYEEDWEPYPYDPYPYDPYDNDDHYYPLAGAR